MVADATDKPTLSDMATAAVKFLKAKAGAEGFFIMIEVRSVHIDLKSICSKGGKNRRRPSQWPRRQSTLGDISLREGDRGNTLADSRHVHCACGQEVVSLVDLEETLVLVTADHAHTMR